MVFTVPTYYNDVQSRPAVSFKWYSDINITKTSFRLANSDCVVKPAPCENKTLKNFILIRKPMLCSYYDVFVFRIHISYLYNIN